MNARAAWGALVVVAFAGATALGQDAPRGKFAGWVQDAAGKRVAGADVVLLSRPLPSRPDLGVADELRVQTGADGMFRAELLHGRSYSCWATWRDAAGVERRSRELDGAIPGPPQGLVEGPRQLLRTVRITGADAWQPRAPLQLAAFTTTENVHTVKLALDADRRATVPTLPGHYVSLEVRAADGFLLGMSMSTALADAQRTEVTIVLPPPHELRVVVVDDKGAPVAGAFVRHAFGLHFRGDIFSDVGRTDASGTVRALVPSTNPNYGADANSTFALLVDAPGVQRTLLHVDSGKSGPEAKVVLQPGSELRGRLLAKDGAPATGIPLLPDCYAVGADAETTGLGVPLRPVRVDARGAFAFGSLHPKYDFRLLALLDAPTAIAAGMKLRDGIALAPVVWLATGRPPFASPHDLGDLRLDEVVVAQVEVRTDAGVPVPGARLTVTTADLYNSPLEYVCDRVGRLQFPLPRGEIRIGAWVQGGGVTTGLVRVPAEANDPSLDPLVLKLSATRTVRGLVVDERGKPVAGARVRQWNRAKCEDRQIADLTFLCRAESEPTGPDGAFTLTLPLADTAFDVRAFATLAGKPWNSEVVAVGADDPDADRLRLTVAPWQADKRK